MKIDQKHTDNDYKDMGTGQAPKDHKKIRSHFFFDMNHDDRYKDRLVADENITDVPLSSVYSGVVSLRGTRLGLFLAELNGLESWEMGIGNAYLEAFTKEKVCMLASPEFRPLEGHNLIIVKDFLRASNF